MRVSAAAALFALFAGASAAPATSTTTCGGIAALKCPDGQICYIKDKYPDASGVCIGKTIVRTTTTTAAAQSTPTGTFCGGIAAIQCPTGFACQITATYPDAGGVCVKQQCGGFAGIKCPTGFVCVAPATPDAMGTCESLTCGGFAGLPCPKGYTCVAPATPDALGVCKKN
ncbi:hypothetical protein HDV00_011119 [Rhizophlyctis rosea]|nr:hypothetical protein HDV00_011119 [Rhizophlyctis rosea]